jgi:hypothetical protein
MRVKSKTHRLPLLRTLATPKANAPRAVRVFMARLTGGAKGVVYSFTQPTMDRHYMPSRDQLELEETSGLADGEGEF